MLFLERGFLKQKKCQRSLQELSEHSVPVTALGCSINCFLLGSQRVGGSCRGPVTGILRKRSQQGQGMALGRILNSCFSGAFSFFPTGMSQGDHRLLEPHMLFPHSIFQPQSMETSHVPKESFSGTR